MQGENERAVKKKIEREQVRHFLHKTCNYKEVSGSFTLQSYKTTAQNAQKKRAVRAKLLFLLIRPIVIFHRSPALPSRLALHDFIFCLNKL